MLNRLLVTGGAGFIGANFVLHWLQQHPNSEVTVLDVLSYAGNRSNLHQVETLENFSFVHGDICDQALLEELLKQKAINCIVHFAAESHVDRSINAPETFIQNNVVGTQRLLQAAKKLWLDNSDKNKYGDIEHRFHHISTDEVFGSLSSSAPAFNENSNYQPNSPYSASKAASDHLVRAYQQTYGLKCSLSYCSNNYGPRQFPEKLIPLLILNILQNKPLPIYGDGQQIRDWIHVNDHVRGIEQILLNGKAGQSYNLGANKEIKNIDLVSAVCKSMDQQFAANKNFAQDFPEARAAIAGNSQSLIRHIQDRPGHDRRYALNTNKAKKELGFSSKIGFEQGINDTINWYLNNKTWWRTILAVA
ncbi:dTDP-glucose 4,6-dehydratase [Agaribacterium haliotis]|uniref:dTDP-glucose 4,6-dehydratase n=1 Tax=Agaribacterium haliotis TaxID=2013869 RepID=UPI000BB55534|nr:dTDP-glucose 4,6-dehydratase [Agaribacterium haliotis]